jgi:hypothetical protein
MRDLGIRLLFLADFLSPFDYVFDDCAWARLGAGIAIQLGDPHPQEDEEKRCE